MAEASERGPARTYSSGLQFITALVLAPLVWPFLVLLRLMLGVPSAWDLGFLPLTLGVHAFVAYMAFLLFGLPAAIYLARGGEILVVRGFLVGLCCGLVTLGITTLLGASRFSAANAVLSALGGALALVVFGALAPSPTSTDPQSPAG